MPLKELVGLHPFFFSVLLSNHEVNSFHHDILSTMTYCLATGPKAIGPTET
jgi:hypothetical protein